MELSEGAGEGRFPALVRARHDKYAFRVPEVEVVRHHGCVFADQLIGQGKVKYLTAIDFLGPAGNGRIAEGHPGRLKRSMCSRQARKTVLPGQTRRLYYRDSRDGGCSTRRGMRRWRDTIAQPGPVWPLQHDSCPARKKT